MSFLHGVLESVKEDESVKKYDENVAEPKLDSVLNSLEVSIGKGSGALATQIGSVSAWLGRYEGKLRELTNAVAGALTSLSKEKIGDELKTQLEQWKTTLSQIYNALSSIETEHIIKLDSKLHDKIMHSFAPIKTSLKLLLDSAEVQGFVAQAKKVDTELNAQQKRVEDAVEQKVRELQSALNTECDKLFKKTTDMNEKWNERFGILNKNLEKMAQELLGRKGSIFDNKYKDKILARFEDIKEAVGKLYTNISTNKLALDNLVSRAQESFEGIRTGIGDTMKGGIMGDWEGLKGVILHLVNGLYMIEKGNKKSGYLGEIEDYLKSWAETFTAKNAFKNKVELWINNILNKDEYVKERVKQAVGDGNNLSSPTYKTNGNINYTELNKRITAEIINKLNDPKDIIEEASQAVSTKIKEAERTENANKKIQTYFEAVRDGCKTFAEKLDTKLTHNQPSSGVKSSAMFALSNTIAEQIEKEVNSKSPPSLALQTIFQTAVQGVLHRLVGRASQTAKAIGSFTSAKNKGGVEMYNLGTNLEAAIRDVGLIKTRLGDKDVNNKEPGSRISMNLEFVKGKIQALEKLLVAKSGEIDKKIEHLQGDIETLDKIRGDNNGAINTAENAAEDLMKKLKAEIEGLLTSVNLAVITANETLTKAISDVYNAVLATRKTLTEAMINVKTDIIRELQRAFTDVTMNVRTLFAEERKAELEQLRKLVNDHTVTITEIIKKDTASGTKGLMRSVRGTEVLQISIGSLRFDKSVGKLLNDISKAVTDLPTPFTKDNFKDFSIKFQAYLYNIYAYVIHQITPNRMTDDPNVKMLKDAKTKCNDLLTHFVDNRKREYIFDYEFNKKLASLKDAVTALSATEFGQGVNPKLLNVVKRGMTDWCKQLGYAYVNVYDDEKFEEELRDGKFVLTPGKEPEPVYELNDYGRKLSKVLLTCVSTLFHDIEKLRTQCKDDAAWKGMQIHLREKNNKENPLGEFFDNCGFIVSKDYNGYEGELLNKPECTGKYIYDSLYLNSKGLLPGQFRGPFTYLYRYLHKYNEVCHIATFTAKRHPCSVNEMLQWLSGLPHNNVFEQLKKHIKTLCDKPDDQKDIEYSQIHSDKLTFHAYPETLTAADLRLTLSDICSDSRNILTSILGNGDAYTTYACDLSNNSSVLHYPSNPSACLDMLLDILRRIFPPLKFLLNQCNNASSDCGWLQCRYGKDIRPSKSLCNEHTKSKIDCEPTSPLMSYLTDGLLGHLPHTLTSIGCRAVCINCPTGKPGMPCLTPLGFRGFSGSTRRGKDLCNVLGKLLTNVHIKALLSLGTKTPATLSEHFGFVSSLVNGWHNRTNIDKDGVQNPSRTPSPNYPLRCTKNLQNLQMRFVMHTVLNLLVIRVASIRIC
ncbi:hypothetical protein, conserved [Babesia ovata]|uniref:Extracellular matrix-binding ebh n=1 Tax=Babesia ovata TaxID=189622 RepID=A0A2H6KK27_9APIC|nr:uncharacterized protein BOVATA_048480 [Babesia ovata]GBE63355.1 hypothetical protein, conserved [Babesia ovata]